MKLSNRFAPAVLIFLFIGCASRNSKQEAESMANTGDSGNIQKYQTLALQKYQNNIDYLFNTDKSFIICRKQEKPSNRNPHPNLSFFVYDLNHDEIVFEDSIENASVTWLSGEKIKVTVTPGVITTDAESKGLGYTYDVISKQRTNLETLKLNK